jgi:hypothetical protein
MPVYGHHHITRSAPFLYVYDSLHAQSVDEYLRRSLTAIHLGGNLWRRTPNALKQIDDAWQPDRFQLFFSLSLGALWLLL